MAVVRLIILLAISFIGSGIGWWIGMSRHEDLGMIFLIGLSELGFWLLVSPRIFHSRNDRSSALTWFSSVALAAFALGAGPLLVGIYIGNFRYEHVDEGILWGLGMVVFFISLPCAIIGSLALLLAIAICRPALT